MFDHGANITLTPRACWHRQKAANFLRRMAAIDLFLAKWNNRYLLGCTSLVFVWGSGRSLRRGHPIEDTLTRLGSLKTHQSRARMAPFYHKILRDTTEYKVKWSLSNKWLISLKSRGSVHCVLKSAWRLCSNIKRSYTSGIQYFFRILISNWSTAWTLNRAYINGWSFVCQCK